MITLATGLVMAACSDDKDDVPATPGSQQPGTTDPGTTDPGKENNEPKINRRDFTPEYVVQFNDARELSIRFILRLKQALGADIDRSSLAKAVKFDEATVAKIAAKQQEWFGTDRHGLLDAETILKIEEELFHEAGIDGLIGPNTTQNGILVGGLNDDATATEEVYNRVKSIVEGFGGYFDTTPNIRNVVAIRGAVIDGANVVRTGTAATYAANVDTKSTEKETIHFASGSDLHPAAGENPFDDTMLIAWIDADGNRFVKALPMSADPGFQRASSAGYSFDGTAHLRDGQYIGVMGRHSTSHLDHARAVLQACLDDDVYALLAPAKSTSSGYVSIPKEDIPALLEADKLSSRIQYAGINNVYAAKKYNGLSITASGSNEVVRDFRVSGKSNGVLSSTEWNLSRKVLANLYPSDAALAIAYPDTDLNLALDAWFADYFVQYSQLETERLFDKSPFEIYKNPGSDQIRPGLFKAALIRFRDTDKDIAINIHTSHDDATSSEGCLNVPISRYPEFLTTLKGNANQTSYLYTLVDSSKILEQQE